MEEIKSILQSLQEEIRQQKAKMLEIKEDIKNTINNNINEKFKCFELRNRQIEENLEIQQIKIDYFEKLSRKKNIVIFGVEENEQSYHDLEKKVSNFINKMLKIDCKENSMESVKRIGKKNCEKIRPVRVTLLSMGQKIEILKCKKKLNGTPFYIKEDYPIEVLQKRRELQDEIKKANEQGLKTILRYDKLIILNENKKDFINFNNKKRNISESPENNSQNNIEKRKHKQPAKINKTNNFAVKEKKK